MSVYFEDSPQKQEVRMMRVGVTSDIHTDISPANERIIRYIADEARDAELDVFIICGDISPNIMTLSRTLSAFHDVESEKLFVAGNHDIWLVGLNSSVTSHDKYSLITAICKEHGFHHLGDSPLIVGQVGFCGTIGWYDYSYKRDEYPISEKAYMRKTFAGSVWNDVNYARWEDSDPEMARQFEEELQGQIDSFDQFVVLLKNSVNQMVYKHAISTVVPSRNVRLPLPDDETGDDDD